MSTEQSTTTNPSKHAKPPGASNALAVILAILFVFFAVSGLIGFNIWRVLFNPPLVKQALTSEIVSSNLAPALLEVFSEWRAEQRVANNESLSGVGEPDIVLLISYMTMDGWREVKHLLVTDEFVTHLISVSVDGFYSWINSTDIWPSITWEMTPLKANMSGKQGINAIMVAYNSLPVCTDAEITDFKARLEKMPPGVEILYNLCQFPVPWYEDQVNDYIDALKSANENIPMRFNVSEEFGGSTSASTPNLVLLKNQLRLVRAIAQWGWLLALILLLLILGIKVRSWRSLGQFIGIPLVVSGALVILIAWGGQATIMQMVMKSLLAATADFVRQEVANGLWHLTSLLFQPMFIQGIILAGVGIILVVLMFIRKAKA